jgi:hypothetical protein
MAKVELRGCLRRLLECFGGVKLGVPDNDYPTDLTDSASALPAPLLPAARPGGPSRTTDIRAVINTIFYLLRVTTVTTSAAG